MSQWKINDEIIIDENGCHVAFVGDGNAPELVSTECARRIVACVNACRDFETEDLEVNYDGEAMTLRYAIESQANDISEISFEREQIKSDRDFLLAQRDELLAALKDCVKEYRETPSYESCEAWPFLKAEEVIAKAEQKK